MTGPRGNEDERSCWLKFINFIGIDEQELHGHNIIVVIVYSTWMIVKKIVITVINLCFAIL